MSASHRFHGASRRPTALLLLLAFAAHPETSLLRAEQFQKVSMVVAGTDKAREVDVILNLDESQMTVLNKESLTELKAFSYRAIRSAEYSFSKQPRWKEGTSSVGLNLLYLPVFFMKSKKHWLTIQTKDDYAVLQLQKNDYRLILTVFETRSGIKVELLPEEK